MHDLVIKNARLVDGTGAQARDAHIVIDGERFTALLDSTQTIPEAKRVIDAEGLLVTPGFVDMHTHYDAQVSWDPYLTPSSWHGCTTVVMGNCGVGFAPAKPDKHEWLIELMEGVEDIPGAALTEGIQWGWETFPEYLDAIEKTPHAIDFAAQIPHGALRAYVMGERGANNDEANEEDIAEMGRLVEEALNAGALGFSTSRTMLHKSIHGEPVPGTFASKDEMFGIAKGLTRAGHGVFQVAGEHSSMPQEIEWMRALSKEAECKVTFNLSQIDQAPNLWRDSKALLDEIHENGERVFAQVAGRSIGIVMCWRGTAHPFAGHNEYGKVGWLDWEERFEKLQDEEVKKAILDDDFQDLGEFANMITRSFDKMYPMHTVEYEPTSDQSVAALARAQGRAPLEIVYEQLMKNEGNGALYFPLFNYSDGSLEPINELHRHPQTRMGLSDAGAHCGAICDGGMPTFMLTHWTRDRTRGEKMSVEHIIKRQTHDTAALYGLHDRGTVEVGKKADLNIIDYDALSFDAPRLAYDLPAGGRRFVQKARGYKATICSGKVIVENDKFTGAMPGRLIRGPQS